MVHLPSFISRDSLASLTAAIWLGMSALASPASAAVVIFDDFSGSDISVGDPGGVNGGFLGFQSNQTPNFSTGIEAGGSVTLIGDSFTRDAGYGLISNTGFSANQQLTIDWNISSAFLENQADADAKNLDKIVMGITGDQNATGLSSGLEISLENGGQEFAVRLKDNGVTFIVDTYVSGMASGWDGQSAVSIQAVIDPLGYSIMVSTMSSAVTGFWSDQARAFSYLTQVGETGTDLSYVFINHFGSDTVFGPPHHFTSVDSIRVRDSIPLPTPASFAIAGLGLLVLIGFSQYRRRNQPVLIARGGPHRCTEESF